MSRLHICAFTLAGCLVGPADCPAQSLSATGAPAEGAAGWRSFTIAKPAEERAAAESPSNLQEVIKQRTRLPQQHDLLRTTVGVGHAIGRDWGVELGTGGQLFGLQTDANTFLTIGPGGLLMPSGRVSVVQPEGGWGAELGDVISEIRGLARGARLTWSGQRWHRSSLAAYFPSETLHDTRTTVGYREEVRLFSHVVAGAEFTSDASVFMRAGVVSRRLDLHTSYRNISGDDRAKDSGVMASYTLPGGVMVHAGLRTFTSKNDRGTSRLLSIRLPLAGVAALTLEDNRNLDRSADGRSNAIGVQLMRGPVQFSQRYQWGESDYFRVGDVFSMEQRQLQTSASFSPTRWLSFSPQTVTQWLPDGRAQQWQELQSDVRLSRTARMQLYTSVPRVLDRTRFRTRYTQELAGELTLILDYGRVSPFQGHVVGPSTSPQVGVMIRKGWRTPTPASGATVTGRVLDQRGLPVGGAGVRLGSYLAFTDSMGVYLFPRVPMGEYALRVDRELLPARYSSDGTPERIAVRGTMRKLVDLKVIPLDSVRGHVYVDSNGNGRFDAGEGRGGVAVHLDSLQVTATDRDGLYAFYNLTPGIYKLEVDQRRLADLVPSGAAATSVSLTAGQAATGIDFPLVEKQKPILLKRLEQ
jgi:hypothetical protein